MKKTRIVLMRLHQWLIPAVITLVTLTSTSSLIAQDPYQTVGNNLLDGGGVPMLQQGYAGMDPFNSPPPGDISIPPYSQTSTAPVDQASFQEGMNPWPRISPYENIWSQHRIDNGLWVHETSNLGRKYHYDIQAMLVTFRPPERTVVGEKNINEFNHTFDNPNIFPVRDTRFVYNKHRAGGILGRWGYDQDDGQGIQIEGFYMPYRNDIKHIGTRNGDPTNPADITLYNPGIPVNTDLIWPSGLQSERELRYDVTQNYEFSRHAWGADGSWFMSPVYDRGNVMLRPLLGLRYLGIKEGMRFQGVDSGDLYTFSTQDASTADATANSGTTSTSLMSTYAEIDEIVFDGPEVYSFLNSYTETHLLGPEIGFDYAIGGKSFQISGSTRFGLLANREKMRVSGKGFGGYFSIRDTDEDDSGGDTGDDTGGDSGDADTYPVLFDPGYDPDKVFNNSKSHTHISPMLAQDINVEVAVLDLIPIIKSKSWFDNAVLKVGYSFILATEVVRPETVIVWNDQNVDPQVSAQRTNWWVQSYNFGIEWRY